MNKKVLSLVLIHWVIFLLYFIPASLKFVYERSPNPIGYGILMWLCMLGHIIIGGIWIGVRRNTMAKRDKWMALGAILFPIIVYMVFGRPVDEFLWNWRND